VGEGRLGRPLPAGGGGGRAGFPHRRTLPEVLPAGGEAVGEHPAGAGEDGAHEEARAGEDLPGREVLLGLNSAAKPERDDFVFKGAGKEGRRVEIKRAFTSACRAAKIEGFHFHDLRHTFATRLGDLGFNATTIAALLGHSTIQMSARYTHATDEAKRSAVEAVTRTANVVDMPARRAAAGNGVTTASQKENGHSFE